MVNGEAGAVCPACGGTEWYEDWPDPDTRVDHCERCNWPPGSPMSPEEWRVHPNNPHATPGASADFPRYWMNETSGALPPVVRRYLEGFELEPEQMVVLVAYLKQWIDAPAWRSYEGELEALRESVLEIRDTAGVRVWLARALEIGIDPF